MYVLLLILAVLILVALFLASLYVALQKKNQEEDSSPQIHNSGVYRLRRSPREALLLAKPSEKEIQEHLTNNGWTSSEVQAMVQLWRDQTEQNLRVIEDADIKEIRTFELVIPVAQADALKQFPKGTYVTRDQLGANAQLIPPFHLGCRTMLKPRNAWEEGDWKPLLPDGGRYLVPDWRTLVR